ncbi:hypothetical protein ACFQS6_11135 [Xanthomonas populi]|uniref:hypothetical protein n=1 Tax=Xanthomonas populi TaxID=53414 RepID=UPI000FF8A1C2|nr:hypothetical protein [Xanthomonas populi]
MELLGVEPLEGCQGICTKFFNDSDEDIRGAGTIGDGAAERRVKSGCANSGAVPTINISTPKHANP